MRCAVKIVCQDRSAVGFRLAGLDAFGVRRPDQAEAEVRRLLRSKRPALVVLDQGVCDALPQKLRSAVEESRMPIFVRLPLAPGKDVLDFEADARQSVSKLMQSVLGVAEFRT